MKLCKVCRKIKPLEDFYRSSGRVCKICKRASVKDWKQRHQWYETKQHVNGPVNCMWQRVVKMSPENPIRQRFFENRKQHAEHRYHMESWARSGFLG